NNFGDARAAGNAGRTSDVDEMDSHSSQGRRLDRHRAMNAHPTHHEHSELRHDIRAASEKLRVLHPERTGLEKYATDLIVELEDAFRVMDGGHEWRLVARKAREWMRRHNVESK